MNILIACFCLAAMAGRAGPVVLSPRLITLPDGADMLRFADIDQDGRSDLLVMEPSANKLLNYHQRPDGFLNSPDQVLALPPHTAWAAAGDVDPHPGLELILSAPAGLMYLRQNAGLFAASPRPLIRMSQVFTNGDLPVLASLTTNRAGRIDYLPLIPAGQSVLYVRTNTYRWNPGPHPALDAERTACYFNYRYPWDDPWTLGPNAAHSLIVMGYFQARPGPKRQHEPENAAIGKIMDALKQADAGFSPGTERLDVNGDGREDLVLWHVASKLHFKTDLYLFLRGADQKLPARPTQILHCRGLPIPLGSTFDPSPVRDLNGDGVGELVLLELTTHFISARGLMETALSHGLNWALTIRSFHHGAFSRRPDVSAPLKAVLPAQILNGWPFFIDGDFNGDGRQDLLVRRSDTRWNIFLSTTNGSWYASQPAMTFGTPAHGYTKIQDLNGDGLSDLLWIDLNRHNVFIFTPPSPPGRARKP